MTSPFSSFITGPRKFAGELRRRRVFRVAAVYGGVAFVVTEIVGNTFSYLNIPDWFGTAIIVLIIIGFPIAIGLAWAFDITDEGVVRAKGRPADAGRKSLPLVSNQALIIIALVAILVAAWSWFGGGDKSPEIRSIAVLPLQNLMNDPDQQYFVDGMHEALTAELSKISALRIIGRTSTMSYREHPKAIPDIAAELNVDAVIEGSVMREGNQVQITVQLVATRPERHLWSNNYVRELAQILVLQRDIAQAIASEIRITLTPGDRERLGATPQVSPAAHEEYLKGNYHLAWRTEDGFTKAREHFGKAVEIDPQYASAYAGLATAYELTGEYNLMPASVAYPKSIELADSALALDPNLAEAYTARAAARLYYYYDWAGAEAGYRRAIELNPNYATAYQWLAELKMYKGQYEQGLALIDQALSLAPLSRVMMVIRGNLLAYLERFEESLGQFEDRASLYTSINPNSVWHARALRVAGQLDEAVALELRVLGIFYDVDDTDTAQLQRVYEADGFEAYAKAWAVAMDKWKASSSAWSKSWRYALAGDVESTLAASEHEYEIRHGLLPYMAVFPEYDFLRKDPRFQALLQKMGLDQE